MFKLMINPGHGGKDSGAVYGEFNEKDFDLLFSLRLRDYLLSKYALDVVMTRTSDVTVSLKESVDMANNQNVDYFLSMHVNAGGGRGFESFIFDGGNVTPETAVHQDAIHKSVMAAIGTKYEVADRGEKKADFEVLRETKMEAVLLESLFIDNDEDLQLLTNDDFVQDLVVGIGEGVAQAFSLELLPSPAPLPEAKYFRVFAGAFEEPQNAEARIKLLDERGINSFIVDHEVNGVLFHRVQVGAFKEKANADHKLQALVDVGVNDGFIAVGC